MKKLLALLLAAMMLLSLAACGNNAKKENKTEKAPSETPKKVEDLAVKFMRAYYLEDALTYYPLYFHDARQEWEDRILKDHKTEKAFCEVVQQQAENKGMSVNIQSFDDYLAEYHKLVPQWLEEKHGKYTLSVKVASSVKMTDEALKTTCDNLTGGFLYKYVDDQKVKKITEGYQLAVVVRIDGKIQDFEQSYDVSMVLCDGQWLVATHTI